MTRKTSFGLLKIKNFATFHSTQTIDLGSPSGLYYIRGINELEPELGANDCGKTNTWRAFCWCLYGTTPDKLKNPDVLTWQSDKTAKVSLEICIDKEWHDLVRTANPNQLLLDDKTASQEQVEKLIGLGVETFTNTILLAQGRDLFLDLDPRKKMELFSDVLQLERWEQRSKFTSRLVNDLERQQAQDQGELAGLQNTVAELLRFETETKKLVDDWEKIRQVGLKKSQGLIDDLRKTLESATRKRDEASLASDSTGTEAKALRGSIGDLESKQVELVGEEARLNSKRVVLQGRERQLNDDLHRLKKLKRCPTCGQTIKDDKQLHKETHEKELSEVSKELSEIRTQIEVLSPKLGKNRSALELARKHLKEFQEKEERFSSLLVRLRQVVTEDTEKLSFLQQQIKQLEEGDNPHRVQWHKLRKQRQQSEQQVTELEESLKKLGRRIERSRFWIKGFKDVQLHIIDDVLQELELVSNAILPEMGLEDWNIHYAIEKETKSGNIRPGLHATILSPYNKKAVRWESWGGGVSQRLRIAGALALSEVLLNRAGIDCPLEILDEPSKGLSSEGIEDLIAMLADRAQRLDKTIFLVDHRLFESDRFAAVYTVRKTVEGSRIES
jgi:DNA repair exonuclease SbcCD ATPase subunit